MKRLNILALAAVFTLSLAVSAQAFSLDSMADGTTANALFDAMPGVSFVSDRAEIASMLSDNASTPFDLSIIAKSAEFANRLGTGTYRNFRAFEYNGGFDSATGMYKGNGLLKEGALLADISVEIMSPSSHLRYVFDIDQMTKEYAGRDREVFDTNFYANPNPSINTNSDPKFQLYIVTDDMVTINGAAFYKNSLIFALDDGGFSHTDFNDLVFVMGAAPSPAVPIPAAAFLLAPGLAGLAVLRKKMN